jgi:hypothetical protein
MNMKTLLEDAEREIQSLRRENQILSAKVEMIDLFACVLQTNPAIRSQGESIDVAWQLRKAIAELPADEKTSS